MEGIGKILIIAGAVIIVLGLVLVFNNHIPFLGKLPGDIIIKRENFSFYFPLVTFILISIVITVIINIVLHFIGK